MILRILAIFVAGCSVLTLWFVYGELKILRGTPFWDFRYITFAVLAFLGLSGLECALGWVKKKVEGGHDAH